MNNFYDVELILHKNNVSYGVTEQWPGMVAKKENNQFFLGFPDFPYLARKHFKLFKRHAQYGDVGMYNFVRAIISKGHVPKVITWTEGGSTTPQGSAIMNPECDK
jgi:hypothetical protein